MKIRNVLLAACVLFFMSLSPILSKSCVAASPEADGSLEGQPALVENSGGVAVYDVVYWSTGLKVKGKVFINTEHGAKKLPGVVFNHGGVGGIPKPTVERCRELAKAGYNVIAPSYRGEDGSEGEIEVGAGEVDDALNAAKVLQAWSGVDPSRIGMAGTSHGGIITLLAVERVNLKAAVCAYGVSDTATWYKYLVDNGFDVSDPLSLKVYGKGPSDRPEAFAVRAPALHAERINTPLLLLYGDKDKTVPLSQGNEMAAALKSAGKKFEMRVIKGGEHGFLFMNKPGKHTKTQRAAAAQSWNLLVKFLNKNLKG